MIFQPSHHTGFFVPMFAIFIVQFIFSRGIIFFVRFFSVLHEHIIILMKRCLFVHFLMFCINILYEDLMKILFELFFFITKLPFGSELQRSFSGGGYFSLKTLLK